MPFLVVAGVTLKAQPGFRQSLPIYRGEEVRAFNNALLSGIDAPKRVWSGSLVPMSPADAAAFRTAVDNGEHVTASGDFAGGTITARVDVETEYVSTANPTVHEEVLSLTITEA